MVGRSIYQRGEVYSLCDKIEHVLTTSPLFFMRTPIKTIKKNDHNDRNEILLNAKTTTLTYGMA